MRVNFLLGKVTSFVYFTSTGVVPDTKVCNVANFWVNFGFIVVTVVDFGVVTIVEFPTIFFRFQFNWIVQLFDPANIIQEELLLRFPWGIGLHLSGYVPPYKQVLPLLLQASGFVAVLVHLLFFDVHSRGSLPFEQISQFNPSFPASQTFGV